MIAGIGELLPVTVVACGIVSVLLAKGIHQRVRACRLRTEETQRLVEEYLKAEFEEPVQDLARLVARSWRVGVKARLHVSGTPVELPPPVRLAGYRVAQESLINVLKHGAGTAHVSLEYRPDRFVLTVDNPVRGRPAEARRAKLGLAGMRERVTRLGGTFAAGPYQQGWRVYAALPLSRHAASLSRHAA